jgi:hypothetical protein
MSGETSHDAQEMMMLMRRTPWYAAIGGAAGGFLGALLCCLLFCMNR